MSNNSKNVSLLKEAISLVLDFTPFVGSAKSATELVSGKDVITGDHINRWLAAGGIILGIIPFGKLFSKGKKSTEVIEKIAAKIAYDANSKKELIAKMERVVPTYAKEVDEGFIMQEIKQKVNPEILKEKYGVHYSMDHQSDINLVHQYLVQLQYGGHAVHKHWVSGGKKQLLEYLSEAERKKIQSELDDADEVFEYLKLVLKDPKTQKLSLPNGNRVGFANDDKKILIIHNPEHQGTFYFEPDPIRALHEVYAKDIKKNLK